MRQSTNGVDLIRDETGTILGFSLGFDFCAEHESGIRPLKDLLGVGAGGSVGIEARRVTAAPKDLGRCFFFADFPKGTKTQPQETRLIVSPQLQWHENPAGRGKNTPPLLPHVSTDPKWLPKLAASWDERGFALRAFGEDERRALQDVHTALIAGDVALGLGAAAPFGNSPISLVIVSRMSETMISAVREADLAHLRLQEAAEATGIAARLKAAGRGYYALKPSWVDRFGSLVGRDGVPREQTRHPVIFFLNPMEQRSFNYGWFTVEELDAWIAGFGPVPKEHKLETVR